jgi:hypothetical protein
MAAGGLAVTVRPLRLGRRDGVSVVIRGPATTEAEFESLYATLAARVADRGLGLADVVRSRLVVTSRAARDAASLVRRRHLAGPARCATSSYIDGSGRPRPGTARIATIALHGAGGDKVVGEYDPPEVPCRFVESRGLVFLSGVTSAAEALGTQLDDVRARLAANLAAASDRLGRPGRRSPLPTSIGGSRSAAETASPAGSACPACRSRFDAATASRSRPAGSRSRSTRS